MDVAGCHLAERVDDRLVLLGADERSGPSHELLGSDRHHQDQGEAVALLVGAVLDRNSGQQTPPKAAGRLDRPHPPVNGQFLASLFIGYGSVGQIINQIFLIKTLLLQIK